MEFKAAYNKGKQLGSKCDSKRTSLVMNLAAAFLPLMPLIKLSVMLSVLTPETSTEVEVAITNAWSIRVRGTLGPDEAGTRMT